MTFLHATCFIPSNPQSLLQTANTIAGSILNNNALQILIYNHSPSLSLSLSQCRQDALKVSFEELVIYQILRTTSVMLDRGFIYTWHLKLYV